MEESRLQQSWRPLVMLTFAFVIAWNFVIAPMFSLPCVGVPEPLWELMKLGMGGYIIGRSAEKIAPVVFNK